MFLLTKYSQYNTQSDVYAKNEENVFDWEGNMIKNKDTVQTLISEVEVDSMMVASSDISIIESKFIDNIILESTTRSGG